MTRFAALLIAMLFQLWVSSPSHATQQGPLAYSRTNIVLMRASMLDKGPAPLPWQRDSLPADSPGVIFSVEIRDGMTLYNQEGWYNLSGLSDKNGLMLIFTAPGIAPLAPMSQYAPLDILMIDKEGTVIQIMPNLVLANLEDDMMPSSPILAFLFLPGGTCEANGINPGDRVMHKAFKRAPAVLTSPTNPVPQPKATSAPLLAAPTNPVDATVPAQQQPAAGQPQPPQAPAKAPMRTGGAMMVPIP
jgi:uncharacterized membrane protein (UPF0127 family)